MKQIVFVLTSEGEMRPKGLIRDLNVTFRNRPDVRKYLVS